MSRHPMKAARIFVGALLLASPLAATAGGPLQHCPGSPPTALRYSGNVVLNYDAGTTLNALGMGRSKAAADTLVNNAIALWNNVGTATIALTRGSDLPVDVNASNYTNYYYTTNFAVFQDGLNPVIYDTDGSIIDADIGDGAKEDVLGFAGSAWSGSPCRYLEGQAVINGFISISDTVLTVVVAHELGHLIGMDHTQLDGTQGLASSNYPLMYPIAYRSVLSLHEDDISAVSAIYPEGTVSSNYGQLTGTLLTGGNAAVRGANVYAQGTGGLFSVVSDYRGEGNGYFSMLVPPGTYTLRAEAIASDFSEGSSVGPHSEDWTGASFQPPLYSVGGTSSTPPSGPMATAVLGGGTPTQITITAGCVSTVTFRLTGTGSVSGDCVALGTPTLVSPSGTITSTTPTYTWNAVSGAASYTLLVQNTAGVAVNTSYTASAAGCGAGTGTCSATPATALMNGSSYNWFVRAANSGGNGAWSAGLAITVSTGPAPTPPSTPTTVSPTGTITTTTPSYTWNAVSGATSYTLLVQNTAGAVVNTTYSASAAGCGAGTGTCTVTPSNALTNGAMYNWFVRAANSVGTSAWSAARGISVSGAGPSIPAAPVTVSPSGATATLTPAYTWNAVAGATSYFLLVQNTAGVAVSQGVTASAAGCGAGTGTCTFTPSAALTNGASYNWFVNASNSLGTGPWSAARGISVSGAGPSIPAAPVTVSPSGATATLTPAYTWNAVSGATSYYLLVQNTAGVAVSQGVTASAAGCGAGTGTCTFTPSAALTNGASYNWFVNASNSLGTGPWSAARGISVSGAGPSIPAAPVTVSPSGATATLTPAYTWNAVSGATSYYLLVQNTAGVAVSQGVTASAAGCGAGTGTCTFTPSAALTNGASYNWFVNASNSLGTGPWSAARGISVSGAGPSIPAAPVTISPNGTLGTTTPTYSWNASSGATSYYLLVQNTAGVRVGMSLSASAVGCAAGTGTCSVTPGTALANGTTYNWFVSATNSLGTSAWSAARTITAP